MRKMTRWEEAVLAIALSAAACGGGSVLDCGPREPKFFACCAARSADGAACASLGATTCDARVCGARVEVANCTPCQ